MLSRNEDIIYHISPINLLKKSLAINSSDDDDDNNDDDKNYNESH